MQDLCSWINDCKYNANHLFDRDAKLSILTGGVGDKIKHNESNGDFFSNVTLFTCVVFQIYSEINF